MSDTSNSLDAPDGSAPRGERTEVTPAPGGPETVTFASWNIFSAKNYDGSGGHFNRSGFRSSMQLLDADVVGLQEVDNGMIRTRWCNLAKFAGKHGGYEARFAPVRRRFDLGLYGNALLTRPNVQVDAFSNVALPRHGWNERRNAVIARVRVNGAAWNVANTHLSNIRAESREQLDWLLDYMGTASPSVVMGDMNREEDEVAELVDSRNGWSAAQTPPTWSSTDQRKRIDWFIVRGASVAGVAVAPLEVSDHCAVTARLVAERTA